MSLLLQGKVKEEDKTLPEDENAANILRQGCRISEELELWNSCTIKMSDPLAFMSFLKKVKWKKKKRQRF